MYTRVFYLDNEGHEGTKFFLTSLPYASKFDSQKVVSLDTLINNVTSFAESFCIEQVDTDTVIEWYSDIWSQTNLLRFFFLYENGRYALHIVHINKRCSVENGTVRNAVPNCKVLYRSAFTTLEMALNLEELDYYTEGILLANEDDEESTNSFPPSSVLITTVELYQQAQAIVKQLSPSIAALDRKAARVAIIDSEFRCIVKGNICASNATVQKQMLPSIFYAIEGNTPGKNIDVLLTEVTQYFPGHVQFCEVAIKKTVKNYGPNLIAIDFRQRKD